MALSDFRCTTRFRVPFCDIDMLGHANHASYVVWAETARCLYFDEVLGESLTGQCGIILAHLEMDYEKPLDYREEAAVGAELGGWDASRSTSSMRFGARPGRHGPRTASVRWLRLIMTARPRYSSRSGGERWFVHTSWLLRA